MSDIKKKLLDKAGSIKANTPAELIRKIKQTMYKISEETLMKETEESRKTENLAKPNPSKIRKTLERGDSAAWNDMAFGLLIRQLEENVQKSMYGTLKKEDWRLMVPLLLGPGGTGKSAIAKEAIRYVGFAYGIDYRIYAIDMGTMNTYDFSGALSVQSKTAGELRTEIARLSSEIREIEKRIDQIKNSETPNEKEMEFLLGELREKETEHERATEMLEAVAARNGYDDIDEVPDTSDISQHMKTTPEFSIKILAAHTRNKRRMKLNAEIEKRNAEIDEYNAAFGENIELPGPFDNTLSPEDFESNRNIDAYNRMAEEYNAKAEKEGLPKAKRIPYKQERMALFLDEITRTDPDNFNIFMILLQQGILPGTEFRIPEGTLIVTAGNQMEGNSNVTIDVSKDKAGHDRFMVIPMQPNVSSFLEMGRNRGFHPAVLTFIESNPDKLLVTDLDENELIASRYEEKYMVSPKSLSPRTWEMVSDILHETDVVVAAIRRSGATDTMKKEAELKIRNQMRLRLSELIADLTVLDELVKQYENMSDITFTSFMSIYMPKLKKVVDMAYKGKVVEASKEFEGISGELKSRLDSGASPNMAAAIVTELIKRLPRDWSELKKDSAFGEEYSFENAVKEKITPELLYLSAVAMGHSSTENVRRIVEAAEKGSSLGTSKTTYMEKAVEAMREYFSSRPGYVSALNEDIVAVMASFYEINVGETLFERGFSQGGTNALLKRNVETMKKTVINSMQGKGSASALGKNLFELITGAVSGQTVAVDDYISSMRKGKTVNVKGKLSKLKKMYSNPSKEGGENNLNR